MNEYIQYIYISALHSEFWDTNGTVLGAIAEYALQENTPGQPNRVEMRRNLIYEFLENLQDIIDEARRLDDSGVGSMSATLQQTRRIAAHHLCN